MVRDAGVGTQFDAQNEVPDQGLMPSPDAGGINIPDVGTPPRDCSNNPNNCVDHQLISQPPSCVCIPACESGWMWDDTSASCVEACESIMRPQKHSGIPCAASTLDCLIDCNPNVDPGCQADCIRNDPNPAECVDCINVNILACVVQRSCGDEWDNIMCCIERNCPDDPDACRVGPCSNQNGSFDRCAQRASGDCGGAPLACFM
jgi:hypothetical protein